VGVTCAVQWTHLPGARPQRLSCYCGAAGISFPPPAVAALLLLLLLLLLTVDWAPYIRARRRPLALTGSGNHPRQWHGPRAASLCVPRRSARPHRAPPPASRLKCEPIHCTNRQAITYYPRWSRAESPPMLGVRFLKVGPGGARDPQDTLALAPCHAMPQVPAHCPLLARPLPRRPPTARHEGGRATRGEAQGRTAGTGSLQFTART
jgi:hypothetical protein